MYRQGDVLLVPIPKGTIPKSAKPVQGRLILAHGEATGHAHEIKSRFAKLFEFDGRRCLGVTRSVVLEHQEHDDIAVEIGMGEYEVIRQVELETWTLHSQSTYLPTALVVHDGRRSTSIYFW